MKKADKLFIIYAIDKIIEFLKSDLMDDKFGGICGAINELHSRDFITYEESILLDIYIHDNRPTKGIHYDANRPNYAWWWIPGLVEPRVAFLNYLKDELTKSINIESNEKTNTIVNTSDKL